MIVKTCGLSRPEDLSAAIDAKADIAGIITCIPESTRNVREENLPLLVKYRSQIPIAFLIRRLPVEKACSLAVTYQPDYLHLVGEEDADYVAKLTSKCPLLKIIKTVGVPLEDPDSGNWVEECAEWLNNPKVTHVVLDSRIGGNTGGTGLSFPFQTVAEKLGDLSTRIMIAGGLRIGNLPELFEAMRPAGVDVSGGIEDAPGHKSPAMIRDFVAMVKNQ